MPNYQSKIHKVYLRVNESNHHFTLCLQEQKTIYDRESTLRRWDNILRGIRLKRAKVEDNQDQQRIDEIINRYQDKRTFYTFKL